MVCGLVTCVNYQVENKQQDASVCQAICDGSLNDHAFSPLIRFDWSDPPNQSCIHMQLNARDIHMGRKGSSEIKGRRRATVNGFPRNGHAHIGSTNISNLQNFVSQLT